MTDQRSIHMYVHHSRQRCCSPKVVMGFLDGVLSGLGAGLLLAPRDQVEYGVDEAAALSCHSIPVGSQGSGIMLTVLRHTQSWLRLAGTWGQQHGTWFHKGTMKLPPKPWQLRQLCLQLAPSPAGALTRALQCWKAMLPGQDSNIAESWHWEACSCMPGTRAHLHLDLICLDTIIQRAHIVLWQIAAIIDAPVVPHKLLQMQRPTRAAESLSVQKLAAIPQPHGQGALDRTRRPSCILQHCQPGISAQLSILACASLCRPPPRLPPASEALRGPSRLCSCLSVTPRSSGIVAIVQCPSPAWTS